MLGGRGHVPPSFPEFFHGEIPIGGGLGRGGIRDTGWMATRNPPVNSPVGGELVVEIYHDIYRVSKTSKRWLLRISEGSTVGIFDDAPNKKNNFFSCVLFLFGLEKKRGYNLQKKNIEKKWSKGITYEHAKVKQTRTHCNVYKFTWEWTCLLCIFEILFIFR